VLSVLSARAAAPQPELDFFTTSAQVLPVLLLALAVEFGGTGMVFLPSALLRAWQGEGEQGEGQQSTRGPNASGTQQAEADPKATKWEKWGAPVYSVYTAFVALVLIVGEAVALIVLATESPNELWKIVVGAALGLGGFAIVGPVLVLQANTLIKSLPPKGDPPKQREGFDCVDCVFLAIALASILGGVAALVLL
jgi:hypothetical protein